MKRHARIHGPRACILLALGLDIAACGRRIEPPSPEPGGVPGTVDVRAYAFDLVLPDTGSTIVGRATISLVKRDAVDSLRLDLLLHADSVTVDGVPSAFTQSGGKLAVRLPRGADSTTVTVAYHGAPNDGLVVSRDKRGQWQAFGDNWPDRARHWLPTADHPSDKALVSWTVNAPDRLTVVANGALTRKSSAGGRTTWSWRESKPLPTYLMVIAAAEMDEHRVADARCVRTEGGGCLTQLVYTASDSNVPMPRAFASAGDIAAFYASVIGPFPYEKLSHLQSTTIFGGMENATAIFYSDQAFRSGSMSTGLIAHETAHQWFGDAVTEREWAHLWLSEGFATYFAELYAEHVFGRDTLVAHMRAMRAGLIADADVVPTRPVIDTAEMDYMRLLNKNSYEKGGFFLHMARALLGDSAFFKGVRSYYESHRHGNATTDDLRLALETASGRDLRWFFDQWLRRPGYPEIAWDWSYDRAARRVYLVVKQRPRYGSYRFPFVVEIEQATGAVSRVTIDVPATPSSRFELPLTVDASPRRVTFDPDAQLLAVF